MNKLITKIGRAMRKNKLTAIIFITLHTLIVIPIKVLIFIISHNLEGFRIIIRELLNTKKEIISYLRNENESQTGHDKNPQSKRISQRKRN